MQDHSELDTVKLSVQTGDRFRGGGIEPPVSEQDDIVMHFTDADRAQIDELMTHRKRSVELVAEMLEITPQQVSPALLKVFIFLHEAGHAYDYIKNFLEKEMGRCDTPKATATAAWRHRFETEMASLPVPKVTPSALKARIDFAHEVIGVDTLDDLSPDGEIVRLAKEDPATLLRMQEEAYKSGESEQRADAFAVALIQRHKLIEVLCDQ